MQPIKRQPSSARSRWEVCGLLLPLVVFAFLATYRVHRPGLYYDEMFVIGPAFGVAAYKTFLGIPILVSSYVGADKAWLYPPIFGLFGISAWSVRVPAMLISCGTLFLGYLLIRNVLNFRWAILFSVACAVHPGFIFLTKVDWGPEVIMLFLKALSLLLCFRWLDGQSKSCWSVLIISALGFLDKFNYIWFIIALTVASCVIYPEVVWGKLRRVGRIGLTILSIGLAGSAVIALWIILPLLQTPHVSLSSHRLLSIWSLYEFTNNGGGTALMWFKSRLPLPMWSGWLIAATTIAFLLLLLIRRLTSGSKEIDRRVLRFCLWCVLMFSIIFVQIALTPQAGGVHHTIMLFPFDLLACFSAAYLLTRALPQSKRWLGLTLEYSVLCLWLVASLVSVGLHFRAFKNTDGFYGRFSPRIEELAKYLDKKAATADAIYVVEWGIGNQLRALCTPAVAAKVRDYWPAFQGWAPNNADAQRTFTALFPPKERSLYVSFTKENPVLLSAQTNFADMAALSPKSTRPVAGFPSKLATTYQLFQSYPR